MAVRRSTIAGSRVITAGVEERTPTPRLSSPIAGKTARACASARTKRRLPPGVQLGPVEVRGRFSSVRSFHPRLRDAERPARDARSRRRHQAGDLLPRRGARYPLAQPAGGGSALHEHEPERERTGSPERGHYFESRVSALPAESFLPERCVRCTFAAVSAALLAAAAETFDSPCARITRASIVHVDYPQRVSGGRRTLAGRSSASAPSDATSFSESV
jgi:hypothetical protein